MKRVLKCLNGSGSGQDLAGNAQELIDLCLLPDHGGQQAERGCAGRKDQDSALLQAAQRGRHSLFQFHSNHQAAPADLANLRALQSVQSGDESVPGRNRSVVETAISQCS